METSAWSTIVSELSHPDVGVCVKAAKRLQANASAVDIPNLLKLRERLAVLSLIHI